MIKWTKALIEVLQIEKHTQDTMKARILEGMVGMSQLRKNKDLSFNERN